MARYGQAPGQEEVVGNLENAEPANAAVQADGDEAESTPTDGEVVFDERTPSMSKKKRAKEGESGFFFAGGICG